MRVAALYDIHGNLPALLAVLEEVRSIGADLLVVGGDVVPGPMPAECLACLSALGIPVLCLRGNGERAVLAERSGADSGVPAPFREAVRWSAGQLDDRAARWIAAWPATHRVTIEGLGEVFFCHATPRSDDEIFTRLTPEAALQPVIEDASASVVVCGHTHMQFDRTVGDTRVVNAGSVGMPFGEPGAYWLLLGPAVELRRTNYDLSVAARRIEASEYPGASDFAARSIVSPPAELEMLERFTRVGIA